MTLAKQNKSTSEAPDGPTDLSKQRSSDYCRKDLVWIGRELRLGKRGRILAEIVPDQKWLGMYRVKHNGRLTDMANLTWAKDAAVSIALAVLNHPSRAAA